MRIDDVRRVNRPASIKDIAERAGVDASTVSRALRNNPWIPQRTRKRIRDIAIQLDYVPNAVARQLVTGRSRVIGACVPELGDRDMAEEVLSLDQAVRDSGFRLLLRLCHGGRHREAECVRWFRERRVAGIVVFRTRSALYTSGFDEAGPAPVVTIPPPRPRVPRPSGREVLEALSEMIAAGE